MPNTALQSQLAGLDVKPMRNPPAAGGGATNRLNARYDRFDTVLSCLPASGSATLQSIVCASSYVETTNTMELRTAIPIAARKPQWVRTRGAARRSPRRSAGRMVPRNAAVRDGRFCGGVAGLEPFPPDEA